MKKHQTHLFLLVLLLIITLNGCAERDNGGDGKIYANIKVKLNSSEKSSFTGQKSPNYSSLPSNTAAVYVIAVGANSESLLLSKFGEYESAAYDKGNLILSDNTISLTLPLLTPINLLVFAYDQTTTHTDPVVAGKSASFSINADTTSKDLDITMKSANTVIVYRGSSTNNLDGNIGSIHQSQCSSFNSIENVNAETVKPFISTQSTNIKDIAGVPKDRSVVGPTGIQISENWNGLWDSSIDVTLFNGGILPFSAWWWTGSNANGTTSIDTCNNWTSNAGVVDGETAASDYTVDQWLTQGGTACNIAFYYILCVGWNF